MITAKAMDRHSAERNTRSQRRGILSALAHAIDMNRDGQLSEKELDEFRRYLVGHVLDDATMEEHVEFRKDGTFDKMSSYAGDHPDDEEREPREMQSARHAIAVKIMANLYCKLWEAGHIDDETFIAEMDKTGAVDIGTPEEIEGQDPHDVATKIWMAAIDDGPPQPDDPEQPEDDQGSRELSAEDIAESAKRIKPSPNTPSGRRLLRQERGR